MPPVNYSKMRKGAKWAKEWRARIDEADDRARAEARQVKREAERSAEIAKAAAAAVPQSILAARVAREAARREKEEAERLAASEPVRTALEAAAQRQKRLLRNQLAGCVLPR